MSMIHPSSVISPNAKIGKDVVIGPFCFIHENVTIGEGSYLDSHVTIGSKTGEVIIGKNNKFYGGGLIGGPPQDLKYKGEKTRLVVGHSNTFRESVTISIGTPHGGGETTIGNNNLIMAYCHVGHDNKIGDFNVIANLTQTAGHVTIEDKCIVSALSAINQFVRIGRNSFSAGSSMVNKDILPFSMAQGNYATVRATNKIGLKRNGFSEDAILQIHKAIRILTMGGGTVEESLARIQEECDQTEEIAYMVRFIRESKRGLAL